MHRRQMFMRQGTRLLRTIMIHPDIVYGETIAMRQVIGEAVQNQGRATKHHRFQTTVRETPRDLPERRDASLLPSPIGTFVVRRTW